MMLKMIKIKKQIMGGEKMNNYVRNIAYGMMLIGAVNWGLVGIFQFDLVAFLLGDMSILTRIVYMLVGISALYAAFTTRACDRLESAIE